MPPAAGQRPSTERLISDERACRAGLAGSFLRYRIMAFTTGMLLVLLVFVAIPIQLWGHNNGPVAVIGTAHGFLFMVYLLTAFDLGVRLRWRWLKLGLVMLAGTVPFASFYAEHRAHAGRAGPRRAGPGTAPAEPRASQRRQPERVPPEPERRRWPSPRPATSASRARATRDRMVPTGQPSTSAASG